MGGIGWKMTSFPHLCACISDGLVEIQELFLVVLVGELEHGDSVDALGHFDGM